MKIPKSSIKIIVIIGVMLLLGAGLYLSLIYTVNNSPGSDQKNLSSQQLAAEDKKILDQLKKIILLPDNVTPTMAIITDVDVLKKQQPGFFANAKTGERLIVYPDMALIFDPEANKIIKAGGIQFVQPQATPAPTASNGKK